MPKAKTTEEIYNGIRDLVNGQDGKVAMEAVLMMTAQMWRVSGQPYVALMRAIKAAWTDTGTMQVPEVDA